MGKKKQRRRMTIFQFMEKINSYSSMDEIHPMTRQFAAGIGYEEPMWLDFDTRRKVMELHRSGSRKSVQEAWMIYANKMVELVDETTQPVIVQALVMNMAAEAYVSYKADLPGMYRIMKQEAVALLMSVPEDARDEDWEYANDEITWRDQRSV